MTSNMVGQKLDHIDLILSRINNEFDASMLSTGQQKTVVLMILLAQCNYLVNDRKINPIFYLMK